MYIDIIIKKATANRNTANRARFSYYIKNNNMTHESTNWDAVRAARKDIADQVARFTRIDSDINGNPRYYIPGYAIAEHARDYIIDALGLSKYRGKKYGPGLVIQSYSLESNALELRRLESLSQYQIAALQFLRDTGTTITIDTAVPQRKPRWATPAQLHGIHYSVKLANKRGAYTFDFWDSVANKTNGTTPNEYDILAAIGHGAPGTFADFCSDYGYSDDSITAWDTYQAVCDESKSLAAMFTRGQLARLSDIN